jgi:predicted nucleic acid-binding protein
MKKRVYIETTIVSYLTAKPSHDPIRATHEALTREWWRDSRHLYDLYISQAVLDEASRGNMEAARKRLLALRDVPLVGPVAPAIILAQQILDRKLMPPKAATDALHLAMAAVHRMDVLLTWNCKHLANATLLVDLGRFVRIKGYEAPIVCTPNEMMGDSGRIRG